jgi:hypothetical protein
MTSILTQQPPLGYHPQDAMLSSIAIASGIGINTNHVLLNRFNEANGQGAVDFWLDLTDFGILSAGLCQALCDTGYEFATVWAYEIDEEFGRRYLARIRALEAAGVLDAVNADLDPHGLSTSALNALLGQITYEVLSKDKALNAQPGKVVRIARIIYEMTGYASDVKDEPAPAATSPDTVLWDAVTCLERVETATPEARLAAAEKLRELAAALKLRELIPNIEVKPEGAAPQTQLVYQIGEAAGTTIHWIDVTPARYERCTDFLRRIIEVKS